MANNTTNFTLKLKTEGLENAQKGTKQIRDNLEGAQAAAQGIGTPPAGSSSSRKFASSAAARPTGAAGVSAGVEGGDVEMYNRARGAAGAAGGTARDFADQARGLGGLVRLYATFAANIFAATAAFGALSRAMDTTNMIKGLDQLGSSSGQALGTLSKRLAEATDNAVSLREAMEATVKASSAGLDSSQILRLGESARKASQALGLSMPDALSRLSRGISKLEPELLDELGIFVRIDDAVQKYALSVGKTASTLTDFERRQAFATAVLAQAEQKFSAVQIDANPYNKLLATLQNTAQQILEVFNKVLGPIVKIFAENSELVAAAIGLVTIKLLNSALPALGQWQQGLVASANKAKEAASNINTSFGEATVEGWEKKLKIPELVQSVDKAKASLSSLGTGKSLQGITNVEKVMTRISRAPESLTGRDVGALSREINSRKKAVESLSTASDAASIKQAANLQKEIARLEKIKTQTIELIALQKQLASQRAKLSEIDVREGTGLGERARQTISRRENERAQRLTAIAAVPQNVAELGFGGAWEKLRTEAAKSSGAISKFRTLAVGGLVAVGSQVGLLAKAFGGKLLNGALIALGIFQTLDSVFSGNAKEAGQFNTALESLADGVKLVNDTLENLRKQEFDRALSAQNVLARANAFGELANSIEQVSNSFAAVIGKASWWDRWIKNLFLSAFDAGWQDDLAEALSSGIVSAIDSIQSDEIKQKYIASISNILNIQNVNEEGIITAIKKLPEEQAKAAAAGVRAVTKEAANEAKVLANTLTEASNSIKKVIDARQALDNSFKDTSPVSNYAGALIEESGKIAKAFQNPTNALSLLNEIVSDNTKLSLFPDNVRADLIAAKNEINTATQQMGLYEEQIKQAEKATEQLVSYNTGGTNTTIVFDAQVQESPEYQKLQEIVAVGQRAVELKTKLKENISELQEKFKNIAVSPFERAITLVSQKFTDSLAKSSLTVQTGISSLFGEGTGKAALEGSLKRQELSLQSKNIEATFSLTQELRRNTLATERQTVLQEIENDKRAGVVNERRAEGQASRLREIDDAFKFLDKGLKATSEDFKKLGTSFQQSLFSYFQNLLGAKGQQAEIAAQAKVSEIGTEVKKREETFKEQEKSRNVELERLNIEKDRAGIIANIVGLENTAAQNKKIAAENAAQQQSDEIKRQQLKFNIEQQSFIYSKLEEQLGKSKNKQDIENLKNAKGIVNSAEQELKNFEKSVKERNKLKEINDEILRISSEAAAEQKRLEYDKQLKESAQELKQIQLSTTKQQFDSLVSRGLLDEEYAAQRTAEFALEAQQIQFNKQLSDAAAQKRLDDLQAEAQFRKVIAAGGNEIDALIEWAAQTDKNNTLYQNRLNTINASNVLTQQGIELEKGKALEVAKTNKLLEDQKERAEAITALGDSLAAVFGKAGEGLSGLLGALNNIVTSQETYNSKLEEQYNIMDSSRKIMDDPSKSEKERADAANAYTKAQIESGKLSAKNTKNEIANSAKLIGAVKGLFKEKTAAYKILAATEKAMHLATLAMQAKELFVKLTADKTTLASKISTELKNTAATMDGALMRAPFYIAEIYAKTIGQLGPIFGPAVATGLVALVMSYLGGSAKGGAPTVGISAEDRQEVQGTGMEWRDGKKVETGGGVFGDPEAKSESIKKSIDLLRDTAIEGLTYDNKILKALQGIEKAIGESAKALYGIPGLRTGSAFGTMEGTTSSGGIFGLFSNKTTTQITDSGIVLAGTFKQLAGMIDGAVVQLYEDITYTKKKWYGSTRSWTNRKVTDLPDALVWIQDVFSYSYDLFIGLGEELGMSADTVSKAIDDLGKLDVEASLRGLSGEALQTAVESVIGSVLDKVTTQIFSSVVDRFKEFGEAALQTVIRVTNQLSVVDRLLFSMGRQDITSAVRRQMMGTMITETVSMDQDQVRRAVVDRYKASGGTVPGQYVESELEDVLDDVDFGEAFTQTIVRPATEADVRLKSLEIADNIIKMSGGLEEFTEKVQFFTENILTDREKIAIATDTLTNQFTSLVPSFNALGLTIPTTRDDFASLMRGIDLTTTAGQELYASMLDLAPTFIEVIEFEEQLADKRADQSATIAKLLGDEATATRIQRQQTLESLDDSLKAGQLYIWALEDEQSIKNKLLSLYERQNQELTKTRDKLKDVIKSLQDYRSQLTGGDLSIFNPMQRYQQRRSEFDALVAAARAGDTDAAVKLPQASTALLDASRILFSSGSNYAADFNAITGILDELLPGLQNQLTEAEKLLKANEDQVALLKGIDLSLGSIDSQIASLTTQYSTAQVQTADAKTAYDDFLSTGITSILATAVGTIDLNATVTAANGTTDAVNNLATQQSTETIVLSTTFDLAIDRLITAVVGALTVSSPYDAQPAIIDAGA